MRTFTCQWPILDHARDLPDLLDEALRSLRAHLTERSEVAVTSPSWSVTEDTIVAAVLVRPLTDMEKSRMGWYGRTRGVARLNAEKGRTATEAAA